MKNAVEEWGKPLHEFWEAIAQDLRMRFTPEDVECLFHVYRSGLYIMRLLMGEAANPELPTDVQVELTKAIVAECEELTRDYDRPDPEDN